jgi:hypothetical protein
MTSAKRKADPKPEAETVSVAYKGFTKDLRCLDFQYEIGKTYTHKGRVAACESGFHACEFPLAIFGFYPVKDGNRFGVVEQSGDIVRKDQKQCSRTITVKAEIGIPGLVKAAIEWTRKAATAPTNGNYAHSATSGYSAHSATSGNSANSATSGYSAHSATSGNYAHSATSGNYAHSATSGDCAHSATSGDCANSATSGNSANSATSGNYAHSATSGDCAHSATSGDCAHSATSGNSANSATSGNSANSATSGYSAHSATSGDCANSATSGYSTQAETKGKNAVAAIAGSGIARAGEGGAIFLVERGGDLSILAVFAAKVGDHGIKADTWYALRGGTPVEVTP